MMVVIRMIHNKSKVLVLVIPSIGIVTESSYQKVIKIL